MTYNTATYSGDSLYFCFGKQPMKYKVTAMMNFWFTNSNILTSGQSSAIGDTPPQLSPDVKMAPPQQPSSETKVSSGGSNICDGDSSTPASTVGSQQMTSVPPSPNEKKCFFKKNIEDGMDK